MTRLTALAVLALGLFASGCMTRNLRSVRDVADTHVTLVETIDTQNYLVWASMKHVFWQCLESGTTLTCEKACDGKSDLSCPMGMGINVSSARSVR